jgi:hypothetical protein
MKQEYKTGLRIKTRYKNTVKISMSPPVYYVRTPRKTKKIYNYFINKLIFQPKHQYTERAIYISKIEIIEI